MKNQFYLFLLIACSCLPLKAQQCNVINNSDIMVPLGQKVENKTLTSIWQSCDVKQGEHGYEIVLMSTLKVLTSDGTFMNLIVGSKRGLPRLLAQGKYEKTSDKTYVEMIEKSILSPFTKGTKNEITFEFLSDNLMKLSFIVPGKEKMWSEFWYRASFLE